MIITSIFQRKRFFFWLVRAYIKKRKRTIISFFIAGIAIALLFSQVAPKLAPLLFVKKQQTIGVVGAYTIETLPIAIQNRISFGLMHVSESGIASPAAAISLKASPDGKTYTIALRDDLFWQDGKKFTAGDINYNFNDVKTRVQSDTEIAFSLKDPYAPFPLVLAQPLFRKGLIGLRGGGNNNGDFKVVDIDVSDNYILALALDGLSPQNQGTRITYKFFPNEEVAKMAFMLGEINMLQNLLDPGDFINWKNVAVSNSIAYDQLVTVFYNTTFPLLSDKNVRQALTYSLPRDFPKEVQAQSPLSRNSWAYVPQSKFTQNFEVAKKLLKDSKEASQSAKITLTLTTTAKFADLARRIKDAWAQIGIDTTIALVEKIPSDPQVLLERFRIPDDPDQYVLWHSTQSTNITHFANPKVDKLLEDGRQTVNPDERLQIYTDFQKHIVEDAPAAFLYYPTIYTITRK